MQRARGGGKLWGYGVVEGGGKLGESILPQLLSLSRHMVPAWSWGTPYLAAILGSQRQKREGTLHVYYDKVFPCVITELTACLLSEFLITHPSEPILLTAPAGRTRAQYYSRVVIISRLLRLWLTLQLFSSCYQIYSCRNIGSNSNEMLWG